MASVLPLVFWISIVALVMLGSAGLRRVLDHMRGIRPIRATRPSVSRVLATNARGGLAPARNTDYAESVPTVALSALTSFDNVFIIGEKGSGKTTVMRTLAALLVQKRRQVRDGRQRPPLVGTVADEVVIFDPHNAPGKWPGITIGGGSNFAAIGRAFSALHASMRERSREMHAGTREEGAYPGRVLVSDEFFTTNLELKDVDMGRLLLQRLTEGRKFCDAVLVATQNDTAESMGITGNADIKKCFDRWVYLGGFVKSRCKDERVRQAALASRFPAVVFNPVTGEWAVLTFDGAPSTQDKRFPLEQAQGVPVWTQRLVGSFADVELEGMLPPEATEVPFSSDPALGGLVVTPDELTKLGRAISLYLSGEQDKVGAIEQAWNTSRGGKADYKRAVQLFDAAQPGLPPRERRKRGEKEAVTA